MRGGGASVIVTGVLMTVDSQCSVTISSPSEPECSPPTATPRITSTFTISSTQSCACAENTPAIIGGAVETVTAATIIAVVALVLKESSSHFKNTSMEGTTIHTATNTAYVMTKIEPMGIKGAPTISPSSDIGMIEEEKMYICIEIIPGKDK